MILPVHVPRFSIGSPVDRYTVFPIIRRGKSVSYWPKAASWVTLQIDSFSEGQPGRRLGVARRDHETRATVAPRRGQQHAHRARPDDDADVEHHGEDDPKQPHHDPPLDHVVGSSKVAIRTSKPAHVQKSLPFKSVRDLIAIPFVRAWPKRRSRSAAGFIRPAAHLWRLRSCWRTAPIDGRRCSPDVV
jgi:hypothetical protein